MAASITGVFTIIDRATGPMRQMERQAKQTMRAIDDVGKAQDREATSANKAGRAQQNYERQTRNAGRAAKASGRDINDHDRAMKRADSSSKSLGSSLASLGAKFAGLKAIMLGLKFGAMAVGVTALAQAVGTLAGGVVALAPALAQAGAALAALPATVGAAIQGLLSFKLATGGVGDAIKAGITLQKQSGQSAWDAAQQHQQAADSIRQAERGVFLANRASADATRGLTEARREARRELVDMTLATKSAALAEKRAGLNVREAKANLARQMSTPGASAIDIESARLGVQEAGLGRTQARIEARRQRADTGRATRRGAEGSDRVRMARRAVADATYEQAEATRALTRAQEQANHMLAQGTAQQDAYKQAMKDLGPEAQAFVKQTVAMRPAFLNLRKSASAELFPHLSASLERAKGALPMIQRVTTAAAGVIGRNVERTTKRMTTGDRQEDMERLGNLQNRILNRILRGASNLGEGLMDLMVAAEPFTDWITETVLGWTKWWAANQKVNRQTGETTTKLAMARQVLERFGRIASNLWTILRNVLKAATPLGDRLWRGAEKATKGWANWTKSAEGAQKMREWFDKLYDPLHAAGQLAKDLIAAWARLTVRPEFTETIERLRDAVPGIEKFMNTMSSMGPSVARLLADFADLMGALPFSPLQTMIDLLDRIVKAITWLVKNVPGLGTILSSLLLAGALTRSVTLMGRLTGKWRDLFGMWRRAPAQPPVAPMSPGTGAPGGVPGGAPGTRRSPGTTAARAPYAAKPLTPFITGAPGAPAAPATKGPGKIGTMLKTGAGKVGAPAAIVGAVGATAAGDMIGGTGGDVVSGAGGGALTGAMMGSMLGPVGMGIGAGVGAALGGAMAFLGSQKEKEKTAAAQGAQAVQTAVAKGQTPGEMSARLNVLRHQLGATEAQPITGARGGLAGTRQVHTLTGAARAKAQAEADRLKGVLPDLRAQHAAGTEAQMEGVFDVFQTGNARQRRKGRGKVVSMFKEEFAQAGPEGKAELQRSVGQWIGTLSKGDRSQRRLARSLSRTVKGSYSEMGRHAQIVNGQIRTGSKKEWDGIKKAMEDPIEQAKQSVSKKFTDIQKAAVGSLRAMGFTRAQARRIVQGLESGGSATVAANTEAYRAAPGGNLGQTGHMASGGRIPGQGLQDTVRVAPGQLAAPGELVVNRHTENRVRSRYGVDLGREVAGENRPHSAPMVNWRAIRRHGTPAGLAEGGMVRVPGDPDTTGGRDRVNPAIANAVGSWIRRFKIQIGYAYDPGHHQSAGHNVTGTALDVVPGAGGSWDTVEAGLKAAIASGKTVLYGSNGIGTPYAGHGRGNHAHVEWGSTGGVRGRGVPGGTSGGVPAQLVRAPKTGQRGMPGALGDMALAAVTAGVNRRISAAGADGGGTDVSAGVSGTNQQMARRMLRRMGWGRGQWPALKELWQGESGWSETARNASSGAYGIPQSLPASKMGPAAQGSGEAAARAQIAWGLNYIKGRYGSPSNALAQWQARSPHWYGMGGRLPDWGGWNAAGGSFNVNRPTVFGAGEAGPERVTVRKAGSRAGGGKQPNITVHIGNIEHKREGDVAKHIRREMELLAADIGLVGVDEDDD